MSLKFKVHSLHILQRRFLEKTKRVNVHDISLLLWNDQTAQPITGLFMCPLKGQQSDSAQSMNETA